MKLTNSRALNHLFECFHPGVRGHVHRPREWQPDPAAVAGKVSRADLMMMPRVGPGTMAAIEAWLAWHGLKLAAQPLAGLRQREERLISELATVRRSMMVSRGSPDQTKNVSDRG
jgi:hypothetical protein